MGGAVGLLSSGEANGKDTGSPKTKGFERALSQMASDYYSQTQPVRSQFLEQGGQALSGQTPAMAIPIIRALTDNAQMGAQQEYSQARERILESTPRGGAQTAALGDLEIGRAQGLSSERNQILANALQSIIGQAVGGAFGAPGQAMGGLGGAAGAYASRYGSKQAAGASRYGSYVGGASSDFGSIANMCCFIFLTADGPPLHPVVRRYRDEHLTARNRRGYYRLADVLVPRMKRSRLWKRAVKLLMVDPMTSYGKWFYGQGRVGFLFQPVAWAWLRVFDCLGWGRYTRSNGEVI